MTTNLTRWNPAADIDRIQNQFNRAFNRFFAPMAPTDDFLGSSWVPPVDIIESRDTLVLRAELPGMKKDDIHVEYENGVLTIRGERKFENERNERNYQRVERAYGSFTRSFTLPNTIDADRVKARYEDGVLELEMPKREEARPKRIEIGEGGGRRQISGSAA